jgi:hypothetical protein
MLDINEKFGKKIYILTKNQTEILKKKNLISQIKILVEPFNDVTD